MSQFFGSNPTGRPAQGPKLGTWRRDVPRTWRAALGLPGGPDEQAQVAAPGEPDAAEEPNEVEEALLESFPASDPPSSGPGLV